MSNLDRSPRLATVGGRSAVAAAPVHELFHGREVSLGGDTVVRRLLPNLGRRLVGAWCFVDHYGPDDITSGSGMQVPPHPHIGIQTVSWLLAGEVHHRDSLGSDQMIRPGDLGLMTAGSGIAHAEQSPVTHPAQLHGVQLWVALPDGDRNNEPAWAHHGDLPSMISPGMTVRLVLGDFDGARSPGRAYTPIVGLDVDLSPGAAARLPVEPDFEYGVLTMSGSAAVDGVTLVPGAMLYLGCGRRDLRLDTVSGARLLLLGGEPFEEEIVMWWNFVGRSAAEIAAAREQWMRGTGFGAVAGAGASTPAPPLPPGTLKPGGRVRRHGSSA
jgi:redox-sensitive bicupin YhaK (pirin superfamily)